jgi:hypothetical protein
MDVLPKGGLEVDLGEQHVGVLRRQVKEERGGL